MGFRHQEVGTGREFQPAAERVTVENGDHGLPQSGYGVEGVMTAADPVPAEGIRCQRAPGHHVAARTERPSIAEKDDYPRIASFDLAAMLPQMIDHRHVEGVQALRPIEPKFGDPVYEAQGNRQILRRRRGHDRRPIGSGWKSALSMIVRLSETRSGVAARSSTSWRRSMPGAISVTTRP